MKGIEDSIQIEIWNKFSDFYSLIIRIKDKDLKVQATWNLGKSCSLKKNTI